MEPRTHTLFAERTCFSVHPLTLSLVPGLEQIHENGYVPEGENASYPAPPMPQRATSLGLKTEFQFLGKLIVQNTFDSRYKEEFMRVELVHKANERHVDLVLHKHRFILERSHAFEFDGDVDVYLLKANESGLEDCSTPPKRLSMNPVRNNNCDPSRPCTSVYQNCFPLEVMLSSMRETIAYLSPEKSLQEFGCADCPDVRIQVKLLIQIKYKYTLFHVDKGLQYKPKPQAPTKDMKELPLQAHQDNGSDPSNSSIAPLAQCLKNLLEHAIHSDVQLQVDEQVFPAHMAILAAQSEVFKVMFESNMVERKTKRVVIRDMSGAAVREMLNFIYTRDVSKFEHNIDMAIEMLHAAEKYIISDLRKASEEALEKMDLSKLAIDEILGLYMCSRQLKMPQVLINSLKGLQAKGPFLAASKAFERFCREHPDVIPEFFAEFSGMKQEHSAMMQSVIEEMRKTHV